jgi:hypothetical protein
LVTIIKSISAAGEIIPPLIILKGKKYIEEWYQHLYKKDYLLAFSDKGFLSAKLIYE